MKRVVSIAAGVFIALFLSFLGLSVTEEINNYNEQNLNSMDEPVVVFETKETSVWDFIREFNTTTVEETTIPEESIDGETTGESEAETTEVTETTKRGFSHRKETTAETTTIETSVTETTETRITIVVRWFCLHNI